jgi:hypothetical protein
MGLQIQQVITNYNKIHHCRVKQIKQIVKANSWVKEIIRSLSKLLLLPQLELMLLEKNKLIR